jgi:hypothetical protein
MPMRLCERCRGFVPESLADCPHCTGGAGRMLAKIAALTIGAGFVVAISIPGCAYGCPDGECGHPPPVDAPAGNVDGGPGDGAQQPDAPS